MPDQDERPDHDGDKARDDSNRGEKKNDSDTNGGEGKSNGKPGDPPNGQKKGPGKRR
jgi:membrane fusion protein (multidrug efflux system)